MQTHCHSSVEVDVSSVAWRRPWPMAEGNDKGGGISIGILQAVSKKDTFPTIEKLQGQTETLLVQGMKRLRLARLDRGCIHGSVVVCDAHNNVSQRRVRGGGACRQVSIWQTRCCSSRRSPKDARAGPRDHDRLPSTWKNDRNFSPDAVVAIPPTFVTMSTKDRPTWPASRASASLASNLG
jgi:hypothetical protein